MAAAVGETVGGVWASKRAVAAGNFSRVLGQPPESEAVRKTVRACFRQFGRYVAETFHVQGWTAEDAVDRLDVRGAEHLDAAAAMGKGVIFVSGHMGATEAAAWVAVMRGMKVTSVTEDFGPGWVTDSLVESRRAMGITLLPVSRAGVSLIRALRRGGMVAMLIDAGIAHGGAVPVSFFGEQAVFPDGPARLARLTGAPLVFGVAFRRRGGRYDVRICPPVISDRSLDAGEDVWRMTQEMARTLEGFVRRAPAQWYAFREIWGAAD